MKHEQVVHTHKSGIKHVFSGAGKYINFWLTVYAVIKHIIK